MFKGEVLSITIRPAHSKPTRKLESVKAEPGRGLVGDHRHAMADGSRDLPPKTEITFIEAEAIEAATREYGVRLSEEETRRNIVTRGVPLNHLVDVEFTVGDVRCKGVKLCEPCDYLEALLERPNFKKSLLHRGGLRAQILEGGEIRVGDAIAAVSVDEAV
jgi:MOSC domain-containing protein YiiM